MGYRFGRLAVVGMLSALLALSACTKKDDNEVDQDRAKALVVERYGPCFAAPGFPQADAKTVREASVVRTSKATEDGWVPVQVFLQNSGSGRNSEPTFRVNTRTGETAPSYGDTEAQAVLAKCP